MKRQAASSVPVGQPDIAVSGTIHGEDIGLKHGNHILAEQGGSIGRHGNAVQVQAIIQQLFVPGPLHRITGIQYHHDLGIPGKGRMKGDRRGKGF